MVYATTPFLEDCHDAANALMISVFVELFQWSGQPGTAGLFDTTVMSELE
jgi:hypothetical protein